ncbi:Kunitz/Bovine pancreatic trypsin inhibitor domain protein, partial [Oesophagostomum dentatum]
DTTIETCLPFLYKGCGGNKNNYKSPRNCTLLCTKMDKYGCNGGKNITGQCNKNGLSCPEGSICKYGAFNFGVCCDSETEAQFRKEWNPTCGEGKVLIRKHTSEGWRPFIGRKCSHEFCPKGSNCIEGKWLAHCCRSVEKLGKENV